MANYKLFFKKSVAKDFRGLPKKDVRNILNKIESLAEDPRQSGCKKLSIGELYRVRHGNYRFVYEIVDDKLIVHVIKVAHRSVAYR